MCIYVKFLCIYVYMYKCIYVYLYICILVYMYIWYICILSIFCIHMFSGLVRSSERSCASSSTLAQSGRVVSGSLSHWEKASAVIGWWCALSCGRDSIRWGHQSGNPIRWGHLGLRVKLRRGPLPIPFEICSGAWRQIRAATMSGGAAAASDGAG